MKYLAVMVVAIVLFSVGSPQAAESHPVRGSGAWGNGDHDLLSTRHVSRGDQVGKWQSYLRGLRFIPCSAFDGVFGSSTD
jgi:hypothetical protein